MKRALALITWVCFSGCTFPDFHVVESLEGGSTSGSASTAGTGTAGSGAGGTGAGGTSVDGTAGDGGVVVVIPTCKDEERNGDETGFDCGMLACSKPCPAGQGCDTDIDCESGNCEDKTCRAASCSDELVNGSESDQDCGGDQGCARCTTGQRCTVISDCDGGLCTNGQCRAPSCKDGLVNANESDMDCGGSCLPCGVGKACNALTDCDGTLCTKSKCQAASCDDTLTNQDETDEDCGGSCETPCADGLHCKVAADCESAVCTKGVLTCAAPTCIDKVLNGNEPTVDCGGSCATKCKVLDACRVSADCSTNTCTNQRCVPEKATGDLISPVKWKATAQFTGPSSNPTRAIDGSQGTFWISGQEQVANMWFKIDLGSDQVVFSVELDVNSFDGEADLTKTDVAQAIDISFAETEELLDAVTPVIQNRTVKLHETIVLPTPQVGRWVRIALAQGKTKWWRMDEIRLRQ